MGYCIRRAEMTDLSEIRSIYSYARTFMAEHGNPDQWGTSYPPEEMLRGDITHGKLYVVLDDTGIHGVFYFAIEVDTTYLYIENGGWSSGQSYGVIHRIASDGSGGVLRAAVDHARSKINYLRMDTHDDNYVMRRALEKMKFRCCGTIYIEDGTSRIAYDCISE